MNTLIFIFFSALSSAFLSEFLDFDLWSVILGHLSAVVVSYFMLVLER